MDIIFFLPHDSPSRPTCRPDHAAGLRAAAEVSACGRCTQLQRSADGFNGWSENHGSMMTLLDMLVTQIDANRIHHRNSVCLFFLLAFFLGGIIYMIYKTSRHGWFIIALRTFNMVFNGETHSQIGVKLANAIWNTMNCTIPHGP